MVKPYIPDGCAGPCDQGRKPCPCPAACGLEEPPEHDMLKVVMGDLLIAVMLLAVVVTVVLGLLAVVVTVVLGLLEMSQ